MKKQMNNAALKAAAKNELKVINESPRYNLRLVNKIAAGRVHELEGLNAAAIKEQYSRLMEAFGEGYWWNSVVTDGVGGLIVSMRPLRLYECVESDRIMTYGGRAYVIKRGKWSISNIIVSAAIRLKQAEEMAATFGTPYSWMGVKKAAVKKAAVPSRTTKALRDINARLKAGKITKAAAAAAIDEILSSVA